MEKLKVGIIGAGRIGQVHAKSITYHIPQAEIVAVSDIFAQGAEKLATELGIPNWYEDYHEILNNPEIQAVLICSSTDTHADIAIEAAKAGKHIFCEKPVDLTVAKIKKVIVNGMESGKGYTVTEIIKTILAGTEWHELTCSRCTAIVTQLTEAGMLVRNVEKRKAYYSKA